jgi:hypothetical protein
LRGNGLKPKFRKGFDSTVELLGVQFVQVLAAIAAAIFSLLVIAALLLVARRAGQGVALPMLAPRSAQLVLVTSRALPPSVAWARNLPSRAPPSILHRASLTQLALARE